MCLASAVLAGISTGISAASSVVGYIGQSQQAAQQAEYQNQVYRQQIDRRNAEYEYQKTQVEQQNQYVLDNAENAIQARIRDQDALVDRGRQESLATALDIEQRRMERLRAVGAVKSSERAGLTLETLMGDFYRQEAMSNNTSRQNLAFASTQIQREQEASRATAQGRINSVRPYSPAPIQEPTSPSPISGPSLLGTALNIGSTAVGTLNQYSSYDPYQNRYRIGSGSLTTSTPARTSANNPYQLDLFGKRNG